ncbi:MAG: hypothetical protein R2719_10030 [Micropruina sp.]
MVLHAATQDLPCLAEAAAAAAVRHRAGPRGCSACRGPFALLFEEAFGLSLRKSIRPPIGRGDRWATTCSTTPPWTSNCWSNCATEAGRTTESDGKADWAAQEVARHRGARMLECHWLTAALHLRSCTPSGRPGRWPCALMLVAGPRRTRRPLDRAPGKVLPDLGDQHAGRPGHAAEVKRLDRLTCRRPRVRLALPELPRPAGGSSTAAG